MKIKIKVAEGHRFAELSLRMADGSKLWIDKAGAVIDTDELAEGEDFTIERYKREGRIETSAIRAKAVKAESDEE